MSTAALPKAVQRQLEEAERIERALTGERVSEAEPVPPAPSNDPGVEATASTPPEPSVEQPAQAAQETSQDRAGDAEYWRKRFETVQGMLSVEAQERKKAAQTIDDLSRRVEEMRKPAEAPKADPLVSDKDVDAFGGDMIDLVRRAAREEFGKLAGTLVAEIRKELTPVREQVSTVVNRQKLTEEERFYQTLADLVPDWDQINADTHWLEWLGEADPLVGGVRQTALDSAFQAMDARRTAAIFNAWKNQFQPKVKLPNQDLQRQVSPPKSGSSAPVQPAAKLWSNAEYQAAFDPRLTRHMSSAEIATLQAEADRAAQENRVRW